MVGGSGVSSPPSLSVLRPCVAAHGPHMACLTKANSTRLQRSTFAEGVLAMKKQPSGSKSTTDWESRFNCNREPEVKVLEKAFAGIPAGARMLVVTPSLVDAAVAEIPFGAVVEAASLRRALAEGS